MKSVITVPRNMTRIRTKYPNIVRVEGRYDFREHQTRHRHIEDNLTRSSSSYWWKHIESSDNETTSDADSPTNDDGKQMSDGVTQVIS
jgi:hypothetical protein